MFITQSYKARKIKEIGSRFFSLTLGAFALLFGDRRKFRQSFAAIENQTVNHYLAAAEEIPPDKNQTSDLEFQHSFRKSNTLRAYISPEAAHFSINFGLTKYRTRVVRKLLSAIPEERLTFLEVGSGSSLGTATASKSGHVSRAIALDYDAYSMANIVPIVWSNLNVDTTRHQLRLALSLTPAKRTTALT